MLDSTRVTSAKSGIGFGGGIGVAIPYGSGGNPVDMSGHSVVIDSVAMVDNTAFALGGGLFGGGDLDDPRKVVFETFRAVAEPVNLLVVNSLAYGNVAEQGGGIWAQEGIIDRSTIVNNRAGHGVLADSPIAGGGVFIAESVSGVPSVVINNSIVFDNALNATVARPFPDDPGTTDLDETIIPGRGAELFGKDLGLFPFEDELIDLNPSVPVDEPTQVAASTGGSYSIYGQVSDSLPNVLWNTNDLFRIWNSQTVSVTASSIVGAPGIASGLSRDGSTEFLDATRMPYLPLTGGLAVDFGDPSFVGTALNDLRGVGFDRVVDGDGDGTARVDAGAYELQDASGAPRVTDVVFVGVDINGEATVSMADRVAAGTQLNTIDVAAVQKVRVRFDQPVQFGADSFSLTRATPGFNTTLVSSTPTPLSDGLTYEWELTNPIAFGDFYAVKVTDVTNTAGTALDGEWINATTNNAASGSNVLLSGDGQQGGDFVLVATILPGDGSLDNAVGSADLDKLLLVFGMQVSGFIEGDWGDGDGVVGSAELDALLINFGLTLTDLAPLLNTLDFDDDSDIDAIDEALLQTIDFDGDGVALSQDLDDQAFLEGWLGFLGVA